MNSNDPFVELDTSHPIWEQFFTLAPIVLIGTLEADGTPDIAPKHLAIPMSWDNYFGFVCTPRHATYVNAKRTGQFTVTYPRPEQILYTSLAASPRCGDDGSKPVLAAFDTTPATRIDGVFVAGGYINLECEVFKIIDGFDINSLITGRIVAARVHRDALRVSDGDDQELIRKAPLFAYLYPGR
ncbi:MAG TPA: flavin reductase, partial [Chromatiales bacterium]|nr:flavin reductase [Chromatiales bacterium]